MDFYIVYNNTYKTIKEKIRIEDLTGKTFGKLRIIERDYSKKSTRKDTEYYMCECKCGNKNFIATAKELLSGKKSCGCLRRTKGFNQYKIEGDITTLYLERKYGEIDEAIIDTEDLYKLIELNYCWHIDVHKKRNCVHVNTVVYTKDENGKKTQRSIGIQQILMNSDPQSGEYVDHIDGNGLKNIKNNLRIVTSQDNLKNRNRRNQNNKSGYRNVFWDTRDAKWLVVLQVDKKAKCFGSFKLEDIDLAGVRAEEARQEIYGEFAGFN